MYWPTLLFTVVLFSVLLESTYPFAVAIAAPAATAAAPAAAVRCRFARGASASASAWAAGGLRGDDVDQDARLPEQARETGAAQGAEPTS